MEADLVARARDHGLDLPQYVEHLLRENLPPSAGSKMSPAQLAEAWRQSSQGLPHTPPLSDDDISRENIYADRGK
ncbi:MAG TPA: hypothetical protein VGF59_03485 [Bryobacteraceae bacterium]